MPGLIGEGKDEAIEPASLACGDSGVDAGEGDGGDDEDIVLLMLVLFKALLMSIFKWGSTYSKKIQCHSNKNSCKRKLTMSIH